MRQSGSVGSDLDGFFSDEDDEVVADGIAHDSGGPLMVHPDSSWRGDDDDEPIENWDEEIVTSPSIPGFQNPTGVGIRPTSTSIGDPPFPNIPLSSSSRLGAGGKTKNASQSDLNERVGGSYDELDDDSRRKEKKKEYRKSYHGQSGSSLVHKIDQGEMRDIGPIPPLPRMGNQGRPSTAGSISPPLRPGSSGAPIPMPPPTSYPRVPIAHKDHPSRPGSKGDHHSAGKGSIMERVVSLHKRFSGSASSGSRSDLSGMTSGRSEGRPEGLRVDTSMAEGGQMMRIPSSRSGRIGSPAPALTPRLNTSESTRSIHSLLSSSSSTSANLQPRLVPDGLPTNSGQARAGASSHTSSPSLVSGGFHLPSPSPASPYYQAQARFQSPEPELEGEEALDDEEEDREKTPRRAVGGRASMEVGDTDRFVSGSSRRSGGTAGTTGTVGTAQTVYMMNDRERDGLGIQRDEERMKGFRMGGGYAADQLSALQKSTGDGDRVLSPAGLPLPVEKKRKSTLKRLSSMGKRHGRKVSDGWRLVSGSSGNSNSSSTTAMFERKSSDSQYVSTPKTAPVSFRQQQMDRISPPRTSGALAPPFTLAPPLASNFAPSSVRSMKQTPSSTSSRISSDPQAVIRASNLAERNDGQQRSPSGSGMRRVSLSDLKIPSRVASAQKGVKEGMLNAKQFHESIKGGFRGGRGAVLNNKLIRG